MPNITMKELRVIDNYITKLCEMLPVNEMSPEDAAQEIKDYCEVSGIMFKLFEQNRQLAEASKKRMQRYRAENPEKYRNYNKEYMREYNAGIRRRERRA